MKKNDLIKTEDGIYRILSIEANRVLAIDCIKKTMPKFYPVSSFGNGELIERIPGMPATHKRRKLCFISFW